MALFKAETPAYGGYVISRGEGIIFIKGAIPGEVVEVSINEKKKDYCLASVREVIEPSPFRVSPPCPYFGACGGCQLQFISYEKQVQMKNEILLDCLKRIGHMDIELLPALTGSDFNYRLRGQFKVSRAGSIGFYREGTRDVVEIEECPLMDRNLSGVYKKLRASGLSGLKEVHITVGDIPIAFIKGKGFDEGVAEEFIKTGFSGVAFEDGSYRGKGYVTLTLNGLFYTASPGSFLQSNWDLNLKVIELIKSGLSGASGKKVLDLYAGGGNFSIALHENVSGILAVEENPHSVKDGERNISINKIKNYRFLKMSAEKAKIREKFDIVILDPPRPGLASKVADTVLDMSPERIVYVSCNPSTLARDLRKLSERYSIDSVRMVDCFPNTYHIESVTFLTLKGSTTPP